MASGIEYTVNAQILEAEVTDAKKVEIKQLKLGETGADSWVGGDRKRNDVETFAEVN